MRSKSEAADTLPRMTQILESIKNQPAEACGKGLLAEASVDPLAQQVSVTHVAGVLLDHSDQHLAQRHRPPAAAVLIQRIVASDVKTGRLGHEPRGEIHLGTPCVPRLRDHPGVGYRTIEVTVTVGVGTAPGATSSTARQNAAPWPPRQDLSTSSPK